MRIPLRLLLTCFLTFAAATSHFALADEARITGELSAYMDALIEVDGFNGAVGVTIDGEPLLRCGYGYADFENEIPNTASTKFRLGSITKQFTSMAIMILQDREKLNVEDVIGKHILDSPESWNQVTIHHLLTHTSGIPSYTGMPDYGRKMALTQTTAEMMSRFRDKPLEFEVGSEFRYSNSGYFLLGMIIESASGMTYEQFLQAEIFKPLGLDDTGYDHYQSVLSKRAGGFEKRGDKWVRAAYLDMSQPYAAGSLYSTVDDLAKWDQALRERRLISAESYEKMWTAERENYAYGWTVSNEDGQQVQRHGGGINGFATHFLRVPELNLSVAVLCNVLPSDPGTVATALAGIARGKKVKLPAKRIFVHVDKQVLETYQGRYKSTDPAVVLLFKVVGDKLMGAPEGQPFAELNPLSKESFYVAPIKAEVTFVKDAQGVVSELVFEQRGHQFHALREASH